MIDENSTIPEAKIILNHMLNNYLAEGKMNTRMTFEKIISATAKDLKISDQQISVALSQKIVTERVHTLRKSYNQYLESELKLINKLDKPFAFKTDSKFSRQELKQIFDYTQKNYFGNEEYKHKKFEDTIQSVATDLGLTAKQVKTAFYTIDKATFKEKERIHNKIYNNNLKISRIIEAPSYPKIVRLLKLNTFWALYLSLRDRK